MEQADVDDNRPEIGSVEDHHRDHSGYQDGKRICETGLPCGRELCEERLWVVIYANGKVEKFDPIDIDFVNYGDLLKLLEEMGYKNIKKMKWYDFTDDDFERGLHTLNGDADINGMCDHIMRNFRLSDEFHIYVEHVMDVPVPASDEEEAE
ncbi:hypothetical protein PIB30_100131 [Stylosanthes scabra]|uniref:PB1-like domain-containing protein n=1 Tax=Stylosanthes scabra TaxID=79078 RepID=A0ABU6QWE2_9FABA|nr:hypothetical protein [Stylosanthes scabra]